MVVWIWPGETLMMGFLSMNAHFISPGDSDMVPIIVTEFTLVQKDIIEEKNVI